MFTSLRVYEFQCLWVEEAGASRRLADAYAIAVGENTQQRQKPRTVRADSTKAQEEIFPIKYDRYCGPPSSY